ncbi:hypothetical protein [Fusobacterium pseudoperiodonticum]|uniref:hypothetical protein n=1 Tax=Fusobacterium pseudoperiodonticum TaxID=2663009 RepID=UPI0028E7D47E|nr:hypothetical protein [Fusobacterium pseudoperiodonticum]
MNENYEDELENEDLENEDLENEEELEKTGMENDDRTDDEYANGYRREGRTCADCIYSDCDGNQLCDMFEPC